MDKLRAEKAVKELLLALEIDVTKEDFVDTPRRVAEMLIEQCTEKDAEIDVSFSEGAFGGMIIVKDIPFVSMCAHHLVFFTGRADVGYILSNGKKKKKLGISKLARLVYSCSVGLTTQETITASIADRLFDQESIGCLGCMVVLEAEHGCVNLRGARAIGSATVTSEVRGVFRDVPAARQEFLSLTERGAKR